ncbi:MAG: hypothetical protein QNJ36_15630 [Calothrix sp. MO_167.B42]|nr:hypothetical protein [Calothrix sp. MO_167.B42]
MIKRLLSSLLILSINVLVLSVYPQPAQAFVSATGTFTASSSCPALSSIRRQANPGNVNISPDASYPLLGKNKQQATYYQIRVEGAEPTARWVAVSCGKITEDIIASRNLDYVLAVSWQPSFCETRPEKVECVNQTGDRFDATNFAIHGLWPQPRNNTYCNVPQNLKQLDKNRRWLELPELALSRELRQELAIKMPGYQSGLHRHEWYKHGTCYSETPEEYYQETIALLDQLNESGVRTLFAQNLERDITNNQIGQAFSTAFGSTSKVLVSCVNVNRENLIQELLINLRGEIEANTNIADLLAAAPNANSGCRQGQVDSVDE